MADIWSGAWSDIRAAIKAAWPDVTAIFRGTQIRHADWKVLIEKAKLTPPYAVVELPAVEQWEESPMTATAFMLRPCVSYVMQNSGSDATATCETKAKALQNALQSPSVAFSHMQVWDQGFTMDSGAMNEVAQVFADQQMPMAAASLHFQALVGESA